MNKAFMARNIIGQTLIGSSNNPIDEIFRNNKYDQRCIGF